MSTATVRLDTQQAKSLTDLLQTKLQNPATSPEFDFHDAVDQMLADVGLTARDSGGKLTFYGQDPIVPSSFKFGAMAAVGLAARSVASAGHVSRLYRPGSLIPDSGRLPNRAGPARLEQARVARLRSEKTRGHALGEFARYLPLPTTRISPTSDAPDVWWPKVLRRQTLV